MSGATIENGTEQRSSALMDAGEISLCSMSVGGRLFGIDTAKVREVLGRSPLHAQRRPQAQAAEERRQGPNAGAGIRSDLRRVPLSPAYIAGVIPYRGEVLTTLSLKALLGGGDETPGGCVLVLDEEGTGDRLGLMVDEVGGVVTVKKAMLEANPCPLGSL